MIVFCPNCGTQNGGLPGARATCVACSSTFDVPAESSHKPPTAPVAEPPRPPPSFSAPGAQVFSPPMGVPQASPGVGRKTNGRAIASFIAGMICCIPLVSPGLAIALGIGAMKDIDASQGAQTGRGLAVAGIILGAITTLLQFFWVIGILTKRHY